MHNKGRLIGLSGLADWRGVPAVIIHIADLLAARGKRVLVVDCDFGSATLEHYLGSASTNVLSKNRRRPGVWEVINQSVDDSPVYWRDCLIPLCLGKNGKPFHVIFSGGRTTHSAIEPSEFNQPWHEGLLSLLAETRYDYDFVLIDGGAVERSLVTRFADILVLFVMTSHTAVTNAVAALEHRFSNAAKLGINPIPRTVPIPVDITSGQRQALDLNWLQHFIIALRDYFAQWTSGRSYAYIAERLRIPAVAPNDSRAALNAGMDTQCLSRFQTALANLSSLLFHDLVDNDWPVYYAAADTCGRADTETAAAMSKLPHQVVGRYWRKGEYVNAVQAADQAISTEHARLVKEGRSGNDNTRRISRFLMARLQEWQATYDEPTLPLAATKSKHHSDALYRAALGNALSSLAKLRSDTGFISGSISAISGTIALRRSLVNEGYLRYQADLARSLHNLSKYLAYNGDRHGAIEAALEAVSLRRRLTLGNRQSNIDGLGRSLASLAIRLFQAGEIKQALAPMQEAVRIARHLGKTKPQTYEPYLASRLGWLARLLFHAGEPTRSLKTLLASIAIQKRISKNDERFEPELAKSLHNASIHLAALGRNAHAVLAAAQATQRLRKIARLNPVRYEPILAQVLDNLSNRLAEAGNMRNALSTIRESVEIRSRLATIDPKQHEPGLARSLNNLSNRLAAVRDWSAALEAIERSIAIRKRLAIHDPARFRPGLAVSQYNYSLLTLRAKGNAAASGALGSAMRNLREVLLEKQIAVA